MFDDDCLFGLVAASCVLKGHSRLARVLFISGKHDCPTIFCDSLIAKNDEFEREIFYDSIFPLIADILGLLNDLNADDLFVLSDCVD